MTEAELGQATIVYEDSEGETVERTVDNEYIAYFQDHWMIRTDEQENRGEGEPDTVRRIPATRVYYVERDVEEFQEEVKTLRNQVQSFASDIGGEVQTLRNRIESVAGEIQRRRTGDGGHAESGERDAEPIEIEVGKESSAGETDESDAENVDRSR